MIKIIRTGPKRDLGNFTRELSFKIDCLIDDYSLDGLEQLGCYKLSLKDAIIDFKCYDLCFIEYVCKSLRKKTYAEVNKFQGKDFIKELEKTYKEYKRISTGKD